MPGIQTPNSVIKIGEIFMKNMDTNQPTNQPMNQPTIDTFCIFFIVEKCLKISKKTLKNSIKMLQVYVKRSDYKPAQSFNKKTSLNKQILSTFFFSAPMFMFQPI